MRAALSTLEAVVSLSLSLSLNLDARDFLPAMAIGSMLRSRDLFTICAASNYG
jgi:hypothetical protein